MDFHLPVIFVNLILSVFPCQGDGTPDLTERAIQLNKEPVIGRLEKHSEAGFVFRQSDGILLPLEQLRRVENANLPKIAPGTSPAHRLRLWGDESLSGVVQSCDDVQIQIETLAGDRLNVPLAAVQKIVHFQGDAVVFRDDFENEDASRKIEGQTRRTMNLAASGQWALSLAAPGDRVEYRLAEPLLSGWFETRFWDSGEVHGSPEWCCEFDFDSRAGVRTVQVVLGAAAESYALATPQGPSLPVQRIARQRGWSRLAMRFSEERVTILINDAVLTDAVLTHRPMGIGSLQAVRVVVRAAEDGEAQKPDRSWSGAIDDLQIAATLAAPAERQPTRNQDDVLLINGDQLFGRLASISRHHVTIQTEFGLRQTPWQKLHEVHFTPRPASAKQVLGQRVRVEFIATATSLSPTSDNDVLEGTLRDLTPNTISLDHPFIGLVRIRRDQLRSMEFSSKCRWIAIDPSFYHFGDQVNARLQVPHPSGTDRSWEFIIDEVPAEAKFVLNVIDMLAMPAGSETSKRSPGTELRTYVAINDELLDPLGLNHLLVAKYRSPTRLNVPVPNGVLKKGTNTLRIYQTSSKEDSRTFDDCGIFGIALELKP